jgi:hypothetical protein
MGKFIKSLSFYVVGDSQTVIDVFFKQGFLLQLVKGSKDNGVSYSHFKIFPENKYTGKIALTNLL